MRKAHVQQYEFDGDFKVFAPIIIFQVALLIYCIIDMLRKGVRNLNKSLWIAIGFGAFSDY